MESESSDGRVKVREKVVALASFYCFHNNSNPLYLLTFFGKDERANLSKAERNELAKLVKLLVQLSER